MREHSHRQARELEDPGTPIPEKERGPEQLEAGGRPPEARLPRSRRRSTSVVRCIRNRTCRRSDVQKDGLREEG